MSNYHVQTIRLPLPLAGPTPYPGGMRDTLVAWHRRYATRRQLEQLDDARLEDVGLSRARAEQEAAKPFWRP